VDRVGTEIDFYSLLIILLGGFNDFCEKPYQSYMFQQSGVKGDKFYLSDLVLTLIGVHMVI